MFEKVRELAELADINDYHHKDSLFYRTRKQDKVDSLITELSFLGQRFTSNSAVDIILVAVLVYALIKLVQGTRAGTFIRGILIALLFFGIFALSSNLTAFNWVISNALPILVVFIPVVFAPEIRRIIEKIGRVRHIRDLFAPTARNAQNMYDVCDIITDACKRLSDLKEGALIIMEYMDDTTKLITAGTHIDGLVSTNLLMQIFYPNTPLHDGAVMIRGGRVYAAACVMPLTSKNVLKNEQDRHIGLRHRAAIGASENCDCLAVVVSEETGGISICRNGDMQRGITPERLNEILKEAYKPAEDISFKDAVIETIRGWFK